MGNTCYMLARKSIAALLFFPAICFCQKNITGLINAEKAFAQYAIDFGTRDAFINFLDTTGIVFNEGKAVNGYHLWKDREKSSSKLIWEPEFAAIASSGEYGVTTGPWEFKASLADTALARGNFTSIWHYCKSEWKNVLDIGIGYSKKRNPVTEVQSIEIKAGEKGDGTVVGFEKMFIADYKLNGKNAYKTVAATNTWFNTEGHLPLSGTNAAEKALALIPDSIEFSPLGYGLSYSRDFAYVYGRAKLNNKVANYLRVWVRENNEWKLLLQTLGLSIQ